MRKLNDVTPNPLITESILIFGFSTLVFLISMFEYQIVGAHEFNLIDLTSIVIISALFTSGIVTGIFTAVTCVIFTVIVNHITVTSVIFNIFITKIIFVLVMYAVYLLLLPRVKNREYTMYISIAVATSIKKIFTLLLIYIDRGIFIEPWYEHVISAGVQIIIYIGLTYLIFDRMKKSFLEYNKQIREMNKK